MTQSAKKILIVGGGISGMCAAIELRKRNAHVDLVELDPQWQVAGAGITLSGPTLRALVQIGIIDEVIKHGWISDGADLMSVDGAIIGKLPTPRLARPDLGGVGGMLRPVLARVLREYTLAAGTSVRCNTTFTSLEQTEEAVKVRFSDGREASYDLVIGADGVNSKLREFLYPGSPKPYYTGQGSWRAVVPRPPEVVRPAFALGHLVKAGYNPISKDEMYMAVTERRESPEYIEPARWPGMLRDILKEFGGLVGELRDGLNDQSRVLYRPFFAHLQPLPWHTGRVVLIGDAVHAPTAHLASGAGIGIEDAIVIAEELDRATTVKQGLQAYIDRRYERCRLVVANSIELGEMERREAPAEEHEALMRDSMIALAQPI